MVTDNFLLITYFLYIFYRSRWPLSFFRLRAVNKEFLQFFSVPGLILPSYRYILFKMAWNMKKNEEILFVWDLSQWHSYFILLDNLDHNKIYYKRTNTWSKLSKNKRNARQVSATALRIGVPYIYLFFLL